MSRVVAGDDWLGQPAASGPPVIHLPLSPKWRLTCALSFTAARIRRARRLTAYAGPSRRL